MVLNKQTNKQTNAPPKIISVGPISSGQDAKGNETLGVKLLAHFNSKGVRPILCVGSIKQKGIRFCFCFLRGAPRTMEALHIKL